MQSKTILSVLVLALAPSTPAQELFAGFDSMVEGTFGTSITDGAITLTNLDSMIPGGGTDYFFIEDAYAQLYFQSGFTPSNTVGFQSYNPGGWPTWGRCKSFDIQWVGPNMTDATIEIWVNEFGITLGNTITFEALFGGTVVASDSFVITGSGMAHASLQVVAPTFDRLRVVGGGASTFGAFYGLVDSIHLGVGTAPAAYCFGDGSGTACPCGNSSGVGQNDGCLNSLNLGGRLRGSGIVSLSSDSLVLQGSQMPDSTALYIQGTTTVGGGTGAVFGDGLRCAGGTIIRLGTKTNAGGASQYPEAGDPSVSVRGLVTAPGVRTYQAWYRNSAAFCTPSVFNLTNGVSVIWVL